jgi:hypothetical protein
MGDPGKGGVNGGFVGHTHFYEFNGDKWYQLGPKILGAVPGDMAGYSLSLSGNGKRMVIASPKVIFRVTSMAKSWWLSYTRTVLFQCVM